MGHGSKEVLTPYGIDGLQFTSRNNPSSWLVLQRVEPYCHFLVAGLGPFGSTEEPTRGLKKPEAKACTLHHWCCSICIYIYIYNYIILYRLANLYEPSSTMTKVIIFGKNLNKRRAFAAVPAVSNTGTSLLALWLSQRNLEWLSQILDLLKTPGKNTKIIPKWWFT